MAERDTYFHPSVRATLIPSGPLDTGWKEILRANMTTAVYGWNSSQRWGNVVWRLLTGWLAVGTLLVLGCSKTTPDAHRDAPPTSSTRTARPTRPRVATVGSAPATRNTAKTCTARPSTLLGHAPKGLRIDYPKCGLGVAFGPEGGVAAIPLNHDEVQIVALDAKAEPRGKRVNLAIPAADSLIGIQPLGGLFLLFTYGRGDCAPPTGVLKAQCIHTLLVTSDGSPKGELGASSLGVHGTITRELLGDGSRALLVGIRNQGGPFVLEWSVDKGKLVHQDLSTSLPGRAKDYHEAHPPVAGFSGKRWFMVTERNTPTGAKTALYARPAWPSAASSDGGELLLEGMPASFFVERAVLDDEAMWLIGNVDLGPRGGRLPSELVRVDGTGHVVERTPLAQATLPRPLLRESEWRLREAQGELLATLQDWRGSPLTESVPIAPGGTVQKSGFAFDHAVLPHAGGYAFVFAGLGSSRPTDIHLTTVNCVPFEDPAP